MQREDFLSTMSLEESVTNRKKTESIFCKVVRDEMDQTWEAGTNENKIQINIMWRNVRSVLNLDSIVQDVLYFYVRPVTATKKRNMMDLLKYIPPVCQVCYEKLVPPDDSPPLQSDDDNFLYADYSFCTMTTFVWLTIFDKSDYWYKEWFRPGKNKYCNFFIIKGVTYFESVIVYYFNWQFD